MPSGGQPLNSQPEPQPEAQAQQPKPGSKNLDSDEAFQNPTWSGGAIASSDTRFVDKPAVVNKVERMDLKLPSGKTK